MTSIRVNSALTAHLLLARFAQDGDVVAEYTAPNQLLVDIVGSFEPDAMRMELVLRVCAWEAAMQAQGLDVRAVVMDDASA